MDLSAQVDFDSPIPPKFLGGELKQKLSAELIVFGSDLPKFREWVRENAVTHIRHIKSPDEYFAGNFETVAHEFGQPVWLHQIKEIGALLQVVIGNAQRLVLFIDIKDNCTIEAIRTALHRELSTLTFRIIYPREVYKTPGVRVILIERRRPRIFLLAGSEPMVGKTETAIAMGNMPSLTVVHGDEYVQAVLSGDIPAPEELRHRLHTLQDEAAFDASLFAQFVKLIPALNQDGDVAFDFLMPIHKHWAMVKFFNDLGFFPILCLSATDPRRLDVERAAAARYKIEAEHAHLVHRQQIEAYTQRIEAYEYTFSRSLSWRLTAPVRFFGRQFRRLARAGRSRLVRRSDRS